MNRRNFLRSCAASGLAGLTTARRVMARDEESRFPKPPPLPFRDEKSDLKITRIRAVRLVPTQPLPKYEQTPGTWNTTEVEIANPLSIYPRFKPRRSLFYAEDLGPDTVMVETNKGITGFGYGGPGTAFVVDHQFPKLLLGEDPSAAGRNKQRSCPMLLHR
jgi:L-rhamnonate dehydratase